MSVTANIMGAVMTTKMEPNPTDETLYSRYRMDGDRQALAELLERHQQFAYRVAYGILGASGLAEDAVQEAFLKIIHSDQPFRFDSGTPFQYWLHTVAANQAKMLLRKEKRMMNRVQSPRYRETIRRDENPTPTAEEQRELPAAVKNALDDLPSEFRRPVVLHIMEGLPKTEVGRMMGLSDKAVHKRVEKGLSLLRRRLAQSQAALSVAVLSETLRNGAIVQTPLSLRNALAKMAANPKPHVYVASQSARSIAVPVSTWIVAGAALCVAAIGGAFYLTEKKSVADDVSAVGVSSPSATAAEIERELLLECWNFSETPAKDFPLARGAWRWVRGADGKGRMMVDENLTSPMSHAFALADGTMESVSLKLAAIVLPRKVPARPFCLEVKGRCKTELGALTYYGFLAGWAAEDDMPLPHDTKEAWPKSSDAAATKMFPGKIPRRDYTDKQYPLDGTYEERSFMFIGDKVLCRARNVLQGQPTIVSESLLSYEREYPSDKATFWFWNFAVEELKLRELSDEEIRDAKERIEKFLRENPSAK